MVRPLGLEVAKCRFFVSNAGFGLAAARRVTQTALRTLRNMEV